MSTRRGLLATILAVSLPALGFGGGYLLGKRTPPVSMEEAPAPARELTDASTPGMGTPKLLEDAAHADEAGISALLKRASESRLQRDLILLMLAESDPLRMLAFLNASQESDRAAIPAGLCRSLFGIWADASPDAAIKAVDGMTDRGLRAEAILGTLDSLFLSDPARAGDLMVRWQFDFPYSGSFPDWFDANPAEGMALLPDLALSYLGDRMKSALLKRWSMTDPVAAVSWMDSHPEAGANGIMDGVLAAWIEENRPGAEAALAAGRFTDAATNKALTKALALSYARENPAEALAWSAANLIEDERRRQIVNTVSHWAKDDLPSALEWLRAQTDAEIQQHALGSLAGVWAKSDAQGAADFALTVSHPRDSDNGFLHTIGAEYVKSRPTEALDWADKLPDAVRASTESSMFQHLLQQDPEAAVAEFLNRMNHLSRLTVVNFSRDYFRADPDAAREWLETLPEGETRELVLRKGLPAGRISIDGIEGDFFPNDGTFNFTIGADF